MAYSMVRDASPKHLVLLQGQDSRAALITVLADFPEVVALGFDQRCHSQWSITSTSKRLSGANSLRTSV
jgi:hypothetical protein